MSHYCRDVQLFHNKFGLITPSDFTSLNQDLFDFRVAFFYEELAEYEESVINQDLGTAVDSLIDLIYITCGTAILHGIGYDEFDEILQIDQADLYPVEVTQLGLPRFLDAQDNELLVKMIRTNIEHYIDGYTEKSEKKIKLALGSLYLNCLFGSTAIGLTNEQFNLMWDSVQLANMSKERVLVASDSKRGSTYDVRKPAGWTSPPSQEQIQKFIDDYKAPDAV